MHFFGEILRLLVLSAPCLHGQNNLMDVDKRIEDGIFKFKFTRPRVSPDTIGDNRMVDLGTSQTVIIALEAVRETGELLYHSTNVRIGGTNPPGPGPEPVPHVYENSPCMKICNQIDR